MKLSMVRVITFGGLLGIGTIAGCSSGASGPGDRPVAFNDTGTVAFELTLPGGETITTVSWQVLSGTSIVQRGVANVANSQTASFLVSALAGGSYTIGLTGTSTDGTVTCAGSGTFSVTPRQTAQVSVALQCSTAASDEGSVAVTTTLNNCATWQSLAASLTEVNVGSSVTLSASATAPNPEAITYLWSAPGGTFGTPTASTTTFTNTTPGPVVVTLLVGDGPVAAGFACSPSLDTTSVTVTFDSVEAGSDAIPPPLPP
jgi:hypothetical protein